MKKPWVLFEEYIARRFKGRRTPGSGNVWWSKEDVQGEIECPAIPYEQLPQDVLIQAKYARKAVTVHKDMVEELVQHAVSQNRKPLVAIGVGDFVIVGEVEALEANFGD